VRILLFGGFLGSGKTSTILQTARQITTDRRETVAIIENEIGDAGVDDQLLKGSGLEVRPLFGGCVCCQITGDLVAAVEEIATTLGPDWLIVEMTGLAVPGVVGKLIQKYDASHSPCRIVTLIDGGRWHELKEMVEPLLISQIEGSDLVLINKVDLAGPQMDGIITEIRRIAGDIPVLTAGTTDKLPLATLVEVFAA
jgi:Putative GTPases (G3E family)